MDPPTPAPAEITRILHEWKDGSREALDRLIPIVYNELKVLASRQLAHEWRYDRMQATAMVNISGCSCIRWTPSRAWE